VNTSAPLPANIFSLELLGEYAQEYPKFAHYQYKALKKSSFTRFIKIIKSQEMPASNLSFEYELVECDLDDIQKPQWAWSHEYTAISYAWGTAP